MCIIPFYHAWFSWSAPSLTPIFTSHKLNLHLFHDVGQIININPNWMERNTFEGEKICSTTKNHYSTNTYRRKTHQFIVSNWRGGIILFLLVNTMEKENPLKKILQLLLISLNIIKKNITSYCWLLLLLCYFEMILVGLNFETYKTKFKVQTILPIFRSY